MYLQPQKKQKRYKKKKGRFNSRFMFAKGDGTDYLFETLEEAMAKIEEIENVN